MSLILDGTSGLSDVDGTAATPAIRGTDTNTGIFFPAADTIAFSEGGVESMRIDSAGNLGVGTNTPIGKLEALTPQVSPSSTNYSVKAFVANIGYSTSNIISSVVSAWDGATIHGIDIGYAYNGTGYNMMFSTNDNTVGNPIERMRINSSGQVVTGTALTTSPIGNLNVICAINEKTEFYMLKAGQVEGHIGFISGSDTNWYFNTGPNLGTFGLYQANNSTSWTANSDERLKTNLVPIENGLEKVASLRSVTGRYKIDAEGVSRAFLIAQDVQAVLPEAVSKTRIPDDETEYLGVGYTDVIPLLVAAIKELKAELDSVKAELATLKVQP